MPQNREHDEIETVVRTHAEWVHACANRRVGNEAMAEDVTQAVFILLWRKRGKLGKEVKVTGWLHLAVRCCAAHALRVKRIRERHEREAAMAGLRDRDSGEVGWNEVSPELEQAVDRLSERDRVAVLLRFYRQMSFAEVGQCLGIGEEAARKRVERAVGKLRERLAGKGVEVEAGSLGAMVLAHAVEGGMEGGAAGLVEKVMAGIGGGGGNGTAGMIAKGAEKMMVWAKVKVAAMIALGVMGVGVAGEIAVNSMAADREASIVTTRPNGGGVSVASRSATEEFVAIEKFARLSPAEQRQGLPRFYLDLAAPAMSPMRELISSNLPPADLFKRGQGMVGRGIDTNANLRSYGAQLDAHVADMTPEQVVDTIAANHNSMILGIVARRRAMQVLLRNRAELTKLIDADLSANDRAVVLRAMSTIGALELEEYSERMLAMYLSNGPFAEDAGSALMHRKSDALVVKTLLDDVEKNPSTIKRHARMLTTPLRKQPAPSVLVNLWGSSDAEVRLGAARALEQSADPILADRLPGLLADQDTRIREVAVLIAFFLPDEVFAKVRPALLVCLAGDAQKIRVGVAYGLAGRKDAAAAPVLLEMMNMPTMDAGDAVTVSQALSNLTGESFNYDIQQWGPSNPRNAQAISDFERWIAQNANLAK